jgi:hypothetical protein
VTGLRLAIVIEGLGLLGLGCAGSRVDGDERIGGSESEGASDGSSDSSGGSTSQDDTGEESSSGASTTGSTSESDGDSDTSETGERLTVEGSTIAYGDDPAQVLDLYLPSPAPAEPLPTLVLAHGGLWQGGSRIELANLCEHVVLGSGGTQACASIDYRLSQDLGGHCMGDGPDTYRQQLRDFADAFVLLQNQAATHGLDPSRMFVGGHSAGGHLAHALNLRWAEFEGTCTGGDCPAAIGAIGIEGIYDIAAWNAYDATFWNGLFACATRKAFGDAQTCVDPGLDRPCWEVGSPTWLAQHADELGLAPVGNALMIHSPADDWVDIAEASMLGSALESAFPAITAIVSIDGTCAMGTHGGLLDEMALANCLIDFVASNGTSI